MNRKLTKQEKQWLIRGLKWLETGEHNLGGGKWTIGDTGVTKPLDPPKDAAPYLEQVDELRVVHKCKCDNVDCHTIKFQHFEKGKCGVIISNSIEDGRMLIIDVHRETNLLAGLEII
ncbi:MAG: hypothetical protein LH614_10710 [Pyrinomonadaceae bacterium]|nr:hypothetical protein [Pyrinomonadaceae bacterium]